MTESEFWFSSWITWNIEKTSFIEFCAFFDSQTWGTGWFKFSEILHVIQLNTILKNNRARFFISFLVYLEYWKIFFIVFCAISVTRLWRIWRLDGSNCLKFCMWYNLTLSWKVIELDFLFRFWFTWNIEKSSFSLLCYFSVTGLRRIWRLAVPGFLKFCIWFNNVLPKKWPKQIFDLIIGLPGISKKYFTIFCIIFFTQIRGIHWLKFSEISFVVQRRSILKSDHARFFI